MKGKVVMVTGATGGIGEVTALELARMGATVVAVGRSPKKCADTVQKIRIATGNEQVDCLLADLSLMAEVRKLAADFQQRYNRLDVLVNNAGAWFNSRQETGEGLEMTWALNHLSYFLLTNLLLDVLKASAPARVVNVSSDAHTGGKIDFENVEKKRGFSGFGAYSQSKLANILFTRELARRLEGSGVTANVLHPGFVASNFGKNNAGIIRLGMGIVHRFFAISNEEGARTSIYLASSPEVEGVSGEYFIKSKRAKPSSAAVDDAAARRLWALSEKMTGLSAN